MINEGTPNTGRDRFTTIILLSGKIEQRKLGLLLKRFKPKLEIVTVGSSKELAALKPSKLRQARLIGFVTPVVVPGAVLDALGFGAYNIHPGPPQYPGWQPVAFAHYQSATVFGATAHVMAKQVDTGPIVDIELFDIAPGTTFESMNEQAYAAAARLFWRLAEPLATKPEPLPIISLTWSGQRSTRRHYAAMCDIPTDIAHEELLRRVDAFGPGDGASAPTVTIHGFRFRLIPADDDKES